MRLMRLLFRAFKFLRLWLWVVVRCKWVFTFNHSGTSLWKSVFGEGWGTLNRWLFRHDVCRGTLVLVNVDWSVTAVDKRRGLTHECQWRLRYGEAVWLVVGFLIWVGVRGVFEGHVEEERCVFGGERRWKHLNLWIDSLLLAFSTSLVLH